MINSGNVYTKHHGHVWINSSGLRTSAVAQVFSRGEGPLWRVRFEEPIRDRRVQTMPDHTMITIESGDVPAVRIRRFGEMESAYAFVLGQTHKGFWQIPEGNIPLWVYTEMLRIIAVDGRVRAQIRAVWSERSPHESGGPLPTATRLRIDLRVAWSSDQAELDEE